MTDNFIEKANVLLKFENKRLLKMLTLLKQSKNILECVELVDIISYNKSQKINSDLVNEGESIYNYYKIAYAYEFKNYINKINIKSKCEFRTFIKEFYNFYLAKDIKLNKSALMIIGILIFKNNLCLT